MPSRPRLLILGLDGAAHGLMADWMSAGLLPTFAAFSRDAASAPLRCTWPPHTATGWTSLVTGRLPGEHGIFQFWDCQDESYRLRATPRAAARCASIWDELSARGMTLGLVNIPMSHPPGEWPGYQLTWPLVPTLHYCKPPGLLREISDAGGLALPDIACMYTGSGDYPEKAVEYIRARTKTMLHLMARHPTDVVMVVYPEIDRVSHHYWPDDEGDEVASSPGGTGARNVIAEIYAELDAAFAELLGAVGDECVVVVVSDHGFGPGRRGLRIHRALAEGGFCSIEESLLPSDASRKEYMDSQVVAEYLAEMNWEHTTFYMPTPGSFGLNVNLKGRQARGTVAASETAAARDEVTRFLLEIKDPHTGRSAIEAVIPSERAYAGPFANDAPDLLLVPRDPALMLLHELNGPAWTDAGQKGLHRLEGVWMMRAPRLNAGARAAVAIETLAGRLLEAAGVGAGAFARAYDDQPAESALERAGLPRTSWSANLDAGTVWPAVASAPRAVTVTQGSGAATATTAAAPESEEEILVRLREMGYF